MGYTGRAPSDEKQPGTEPVLSGRQWFAQSYYCWEHPSRSPAFVSARVIRAHVHAWSPPPPPSPPHADKQRSTKVTESWQISAAAESLTWGCWIDKPSMGTLLAFSSFWEEQDERWNWANAVTSLANIKPQLILCRRGCKASVVAYKQVHDGINIDFIIVRKLQPK